jgi:hypothetical protein
MSKNQLSIVYVLVFIKMKNKLDSLGLLPGYRSKGYSEQLMKAIIREPKLQKSKTWMLKTPMLTDYMNALVLQH